MVAAYWNIGKIIVEEEQKGKKRADYGAYLVKILSSRLTKEYGRGFTQSNLFYMRQFFITFPKFHALRGGEAGLIIGRCCILKISKRGIFTQ